MSTRSVTSRTYESEVRDNPTDNRYEVQADGELAGFTGYVLRPGRIAFVHTEIHEPYEGLGLGSRPARAALDDARAKGLLVMPFCPFIAGFIERHLDEYRDLVDPEMLTGDRT
jgi:predicted GNAT family acetyltransferase